MKHVILIAFLLLGGILAGHAQPKETEKRKEKQMSGKSQSEIYFAGGCFWGTEYFMRQVRGVKDTEVGYANGITSKPTYKEVCTGNTGAAETVKVSYDPRMVKFELLLELYFKTIDPTSLNRQGGDRGTQYRTGIYYTDPADLPIIESAMSRLAKNYEKPLVVEVLPLSNYYAAEDYHQAYLDKNPGGYCHISPDLFDFARKANSSQGQEAE